MINPLTLKQDFPILSRLINGKSLIYLDNASTTQKPQSVINALTEFYEQHNANIHRGIYTLSEESTDLYEKSRKTTQQFINAQHAEEIIFTRNTTESINLVAKTWGNQNIQKGDHILVSALEHHSNLVPWQELCREKSAILDVIPMNADGTLMLDQLDTLITKQTKLIAITHISNVLGTIVPIEKIIQKAHAVGALILIDAAQSTPHMPIDVQSLGCDFLVFSGHKMLGPTGVGILYGQREILSAMPPFLHGGDMVLEVSQQKASWNALPYKFEAGTPNIADVVAFEKAVTYLTNIGLDNIRQHETTLLTYALGKLAEIPGLTLYGPQNTKRQAGIISFNIDGVHAHDTASIFNETNVCIRSGHHCSQPIMNTLGVSSTARMSFYLYNSTDDIDAAISAIENVKKTFKKA